MISYFTLLLYFSYIILFLYRSPPGHLKHSVIHSDLKNLNVFSKKIKCKVNLCNIASLQYNYLGTITSNNWLKRIVNITYLKICSDFIFAASCHRTCFFFFFYIKHSHGNWYMHWCAWEKNKYGQRSQKKSYKMHAFCSFIECRISITKLVKNCWITVLQIFRSKWCNL